MPYLISIFLFFFFIFIYAANHKTQKAIHLDEE